MQVLEREGSVARLTPYLLEQGEAKGTVLIFPGGGYRFVSPRESKPVADAFNRGGYHAFVLDYTVAEPLPLGTKPLADAAWAIAQIRGNARAYGVDPDKIAVCGFSAGGHLAASLGVYWHNPGFFGGTEPAEVYKPNGLILCYAVLSGGMHRHGGSFDNLVGEGQPAKARFAYSLEQQVSQNTPPTFLWHTAEDSSVPVENSLLFASKLSAYEIPFEMHVFPYGSHGLSLATPEVSESHRPADPHVAKWIDLCVDWLGITLK